MIEAGDCRLLLDCGFALKHIEVRLAQLGVEPETLSAVLVTHEHGDHIRGAGPFCRRYGAPLWMTHGTWRGSKQGRVEQLNLFHPDQGQFRVGDIVITPFTVPHDTREPCQYHFHFNKLRLGVLTDTGYATPHVLEMLNGVDGLILEANHDERMLADGPYPPYLQRRVGGNQGHLSNRQAVEILRRLETGSLQQLVAAHLSEKNNCPKLVRETLSEALPEMEQRTSLLSQESVSDWFEVLG